MHFNKPDQKLEPTRASCWLLQHASGCHAPHLPCLVLWSCMALLTTLCVVAGGAVSLLDPHLLSEGRGAFKAASRLSTAFRGRLRCLSAAWAATTSCWACCV
jgi:hypothetical protein